MWQKVAKFKGAEYFRKALYLFHHHRRQESRSQAGNLHTQVGKQAGESKLGLKAITGSHNRARKRRSKVRKNLTNRMYLTKAQTD